MKVSEWIAANPGAAPTVASDASLAAIIEELLRRPGARDVYVVSDEGRVIGHLSHKRLIRTVLAEHHPWPTRRQLMEKVAGGPARELNAQSHHGEDDTPGRAPGSPARG